MQYKQLFWLHIKKSAGISTRNYLQPHYVRVDRIRKPKCFIQSPPEEHNDILNNYRIILGDYQFKRCQFAKKYLYPDTWDEIFSFAFSREPVDRCISMFYYLYWKDQSLVNRLKSTVLRYIDTRKLHYSTSYAFDHFLDLALQARESDSIFIPIDNHFTTHTAPMWDDVTDEDGRILLTKIYRLEHLIEGVNQAFEACGLDKRIEPDEKKFNQSSIKRRYEPSPQQLKKIERIYAHDFDLYETATLDI